jgi:hypothetical protein
VLDSSFFSAKTCHAIAICKRAGALAGMLALPTSVGCAGASPPERLDTPPRASIAATREEPAREHAATAVLEPTPELTFDAPSERDEPAPDVAPQDRVEPEVSAPQLPCQRAQVGRDMRSFPTRTSVERLELTMRGDADELRALGGPGQVDVSMFQGATVLLAELRGPDARARCMAMIRGYAAQGSGRRVIEACAPCE